ncbi:MAG: hypothetical protein C3F13_06935 [Anaerolineales bacterium]|nr:MAG: hypothetical protein C3F13_06935 [Anaerolineales bacterium]
MHSKVKGYILLSSIIVILSAFAVFHLAVKANPLDGDTDNLISETLNVRVNTYLPSLNRNVCYSEYQDSPFSIEIAALHQLTPTSTMSQDDYEAQFYSWYNQSFPTLIDALKDIGAEWTRVMIRWQDIQPNNAQEWIFSDYDNRLGQISEAGVNMIAIIDQPPTWAGDQTSCERFTIAHEAEYLQFLTQVVTRYRKPPYNIKTWEIFNEPDNCYGGDYYPLYVEFLQKSFQKIKEIDPSATVLMGGIAYDWFKGEGDPKAPFDRYFPDNVMLLDGGGYMDAFNFHYFPDFAPEWERWNIPPRPTCYEDGISYTAGGIDILAKRNYFNNRMNTCYQVYKPIWLTETGQHGYTGDEGSLRNQAYYVIKGYTRGLAAGIKNITWYELADNLDGFGQSLLYPDLSIKPGFTTYKTMVEALKGYRYLRTLDISGGEGYVFSNSCGQEKIFAWGSDVPMIIPQAKMVKITDYLGQVTQIWDGGPGDGDNKTNGAIQIQLVQDDMAGSTHVTGPVPIPVIVYVASK